MKSLHEIRGNEPLLEESLDSKETTKLQQLVRVGFVDKEELTRLKRALAKETTNLTRGEKDLLVGTFHKLLDHVLNNQQLFQKTKSSYAAEEIMNEGPDVSHEFGYQSGDRVDRVHAVLNTKGYKKLSTGEYEHPLTKKRVALLTKDDKVWKTMHESARDPKDEVHNFAFPVLLLLRRKSIRLFPDNKKVALYHSEKLQRYFSVPSTGDAIAEQVEELLGETTAAAKKKKPSAPSSGLKTKPFAPDSGGAHSSGVMSTLKGIVQNQEPAQIKFLDGSRLKVDLLTAHAILTVYDRLSDLQNKVNFDKRLNKNNECFMKILAFCHKHYISGQQNQPA